LHFGVNDIISFEKLVRNLDKMAVANLGQQHHRYLNSCFKGSWEYLYLFGVISYYYIQSILFNLVVCVLKLIFLMFLYSLDSTTILGYLSY
jgi:hypothetical protein